ncbi:hypothetical protein [Ramlibacter alkalitolerans]|uniref:Uncharacterized protein n=1 Tax=Ramlibacter alkalitolerans TaxID=2039631 RepID=A0ABS1JWX1_9BURK|nr:hypothetical protein [Ramlibacter alkalitolerans]MBL0428728.1 hypothetical protein [Ramlibacter alkalitolerans]
MARTRTSSDLKFLLNEHAALRGAVECAERNIQALGVLVAASEARLNGRRAQLEAQLRSVELHRQELAAIDLVVGATRPDVNPATINSVRAWSSPLRSRGAVKELVLGLLQDAAPESVGTMTLVAPAAAAFAWPMTSPEERDAATRIVRRVLQKARDAGLVTPVHGTAGGREGKWLWRSQAPDVSQFLADALAYDGQNSDIAGAEVGGQRTGSRVG